MRSVKYKIPVCENGTEIPVVRRYLLHKFSYGRFNITLSRSHVVDGVDRARRSIGGDQTPVPRRVRRSFHRPFVALRITPRNRLCQECPTEDFKLLTIHSTCFIERFTTVTQTMTVQRRNRRKTGKPRWEDGDVARFYFR